MSKLEQVNHPSHYNKPGRKECIVEMEELFGERITSIFCLTNAYKYLYRAGNKDNNPKEQDLNKASWYFNRVKPCTVRGRNEIKLFLEVRKELERHGIKAG